MSQPNTYTATGLCTRCGEFRPMDELNMEAFFHHGAHGLECKDRKACERRKRKNQRRERR